MKTMNITSGLLVATLALATTACSDEDNAIVNPSPETSRVLIVHASPNTPGVDVFVDDGAAAVTNLQFPDNTGYVQLESGARNVKANVTGAGLAGAPINATLTLAPNTNYTVFAADVIDNITPLVLVDDLTAPAAGFAHVRFVHLSPDAPAVDIALSTDGSVVFGNVAFKETSGSTPGAFTPLPAGSYPLDVRVAGTATVALDLGTITLEAGKIYTVFARGFLAGDGSALNPALGAEIIVNN
ncbi:MAG TPA: DUF4397 domain-containing protein [candidate division Zixibacteria bacterium]|nr:DUF4397 domain-containing protein [candidate division Zixibacteria bacterium]